MKRLVAFICMLAMIFAGLGAIAPSASAKKVDRKPCVSKAEFRSIRGGMTQSQVASIFDTDGYQIRSFVDYVDDGYWDSYYVDDGYYDYIDYDGDGVYDDVQWIDLGYWVDNWVDTSYTLVDTYRTYGKCKSFNHGRKRVAINFDNYTSNGAGMRVYSKYANNPWTFWARTVEPNKSKPADKTPKNTPAPHRNAKRTVIKIGASK